MSLPFPTSPRRRRRAGLPALALLVGMAGLPSLAQPVGPTAPGPRPTPEQLQKVFPEQRRLTLRDHQARIAILQRGERCLQSAGNSDGLRDCMRQEREAMQQQRRQHMEDVRALYQRNSLPAPQWRKRLGKPQGRPPEGPGAEI